MNRVGWPLFARRVNRDATSTDFNVYNRHAIDNAGNGHRAIRRFKDGLRVIGSTAGVDAVDNAALTGSGVPIYWMGASASAARVADDYADLLEGSWDSLTPHTKAGETGGLDVVFTGSTGAGRRKVANGASEALGAAGGVRAGWPPGGRPMDHVAYDRHDRLGLYALSQVFTVDDLPRFASAKIVSTPLDGVTYRYGEGIAIEWTLDEAVFVHGVPTLALTLGRAEAGATGKVRRIPYVSTSGGTTRAGVLATQPRPCRGRLPFAATERRAGSCGGRLPPCSRLMPGLRTRGRSAR